MPPTGQYDRTQSVGWQKYVQSMQAKAKQPAKKQPAKKRARPAPAEPPTEPAPAEPKKEEVDIRYYIARFRESLDDLKDEYNKVLGTTATTPIEEVLAEVCSAFDLKSIEYTRMIEDTHTVVRR